MPKLHPVPTIMLDVGKIYFTNPSKTGTNLEGFRSAYIYLGRTDDNRFLWCFIGDYGVLDDPVVHKENTLDAHGAPVSITVKGYFIEECVCVTKRRKDCYVPTVPAIRDFTLHPVWQKRLRDIYEQSDGANLGVWC